MSYLKEELKSLLKNQGILPSKGLGQNFLVDQAAVRSMVSAVGARKTDTVVEVGPGPGVLTGELLKSAKKVIAVEKDPKMARILEQKHGNSENLEIVNADILKWIFKDKDYILAGNIPFYLTAPVIRKFLEAENQPKEIIFIIQKEVAQRICARPPRMSLLAVSVQAYAQAKIISYIKKDSFWPRPKIDSAIIRITPKATVIPDDFFSIVKAGFSQPRKQLANNLSKKLKIEKKEAAEWLLENNIQPNQRAETLAVEDWLKLSRHTH
ncbi:MAG: 16S rRNA (adenine(1518)-N(6)/adenine(1519)-N(6))-dimethyltransferase RsmA [Candidatus Paceibacterota bacterium]|jgi:16S rRNA (adenine1518-N6/adenine1519-N6)-dimethyltransferase